MHDYSTRTPDTNAQSDVYCVGLPHPYREKLPRGTGMLAQYMRDGITMHVLLDKCSGADVQAFQVCERKFGLLPGHGGYIWLLRDGVTTWDAPYSPVIERRRAGRCVVRRGAWTAIPSHHQAYPDR